MDACQLIRERLQELGYEQKELAKAAQVTESYVSQLLSRRRTPPAPDRTDIYGKMERFLKLPTGTLVELAQLERREALKRNLGVVPRPLNEGVREFVLFKCRSTNEPQIRAEFERHAFGTLERLATQTLIDVAKDTAREDLNDDLGIQELARLSGLSFEEARVITLDFLDTDVFNVTVEHCKSYLDSLIESWAIDLSSFRMDIVLNHELGRRHSRRFEFVESAVVEEETGFRQFLRDSRLSGDADEDEIAFLKSLRFRSRRPNAIYYYRALQILKDPIHFAEGDDG